MIFRKIAAWLALAALAGPAFAGTLQKPLTIKNGQTQQLQSGDTLSVQTTGSVGNAGTAGTLSQFFDGSSGTPVTSILPTIGISRYETINQDTQNAANAALYVQSTGNNTSSGVIAMTTGISGFATQTGNGDAVGLFGYGVNSGTGNHFAYGGFFNAVAFSAGTSAIGAEVFGENRTGSNAPLVFGSTPTVTGLHVGAGGTQTPTTAIWVSNNTSGGGTPAWDAGVYFSPGAVISNTIVDDSSSTYSYRDVGSHTVGINLSGGTYSQAPFASNNFNILPSGSLFSTTPPTLAWTIDASSAQVTIANGNSSAMAAGNGLIVVEDSVNSHSAIYLCSAGTCSLVSSVGTTWVATTTTPAAGKMSIAFNGSAYAIYNNQGASETVRVASTRLKPTP